MGAPPPRFNMADHCLGPGPQRPGDGLGLLVVHDPVEPLRGAERWTFGELDRAVRACASGLLALGLVRGDRVVIRLGSTSAFPLLYFGAMAAGLVAVPTSSQLTQEEVHFVVGDCQPSVIALGPGLEVETALPVITTSDVDDWVRATEPGAYAATDADEPAFLVYTSGTSGIPKGVLHAHRSVWGRRPMYAGWSGLGPGDVMVHAGAFNWTYTLGVGLADPWAVGATAVVLDGPREPQVWPRIIEATGATVFAAVPGVYRQILARGHLDAHDVSSLRHGLTAGEALPPSIRAQWRSATGTELHEALGMSEISTFVSSGPTVAARDGSPGRPQEGRRVAVLPVDGGDDPLPAGESGLLAVHRSDPGVMLGYWERPDEDATSWRGEWFVSGDLVHLDEDGYVVHHGRVDDVMTSMGYRVSPLEVEHCLEQLDSVADVGVAEVVVREGISLITAFVVPSPCWRGEDEVIEHARAHLAAYKCPRQVVLVDALPRTANGKVIRRELASRPSRPAPSPGDRHASATPG